MRVEHPAPFSPKWRARWIWHERPAIRAETATRPVLTDPRTSVALLRRRIDLDHVPDLAPARLWTDGRHRLVVNGVELARGPVRSDPRRGHYDVVDLAPALRPGENVVAVTARHFGRATSWWMPAPPTYTLGAGSFVFEALLGDTWLVSDRDWRVAPGAAWSHVDPPGDVAALPVESFDSGRHPWGWDEIGFDDRDWSPAFEITPMHTGASGDPRASSDPFGMLRPPVRVAFPSGATHAAPRTHHVTAVDRDRHDDPVHQVLADEAVVGEGDPAAPGAPAAVHLSRHDLGRVAAGTIRLQLPSDTAAGTVIDLAVAEHLDGQGRLAPLGQHAGLRVVARGGAETIESLDVIGGRHVHAAVRSSTAVSPEIGIELHDRHRPRPAGASFSCSDADLQRIFEIGLRTVDLCSLDAYVDCPTREQRAWTGDAVVHQSVDLVTNPDWSMARWHPQLAAAPRPDGMLAMAPASDFADDDRFFVPDWALHWIRSVRNLQDYTGDRALVAELAPVAERVLRWFESYLRSDGLLEWVDGWCLLDWSSVYGMGASSILNALWARGLEDFTAICDWLDNPGAARWARERRADVAAGFDRFWRAEVGGYADHELDGVLRPATSQAAGAAALAAGLVPRERIDAVIGRITDPARLIHHSWYMDTVTVDGGHAGAMYLAVGYPDPDWDVDEQVVECEPFFRYVLHDGLARAGRADLVADLCREWNRFVERGETTWPECWQGGTRCHGWSSTPTRDLIVHTLGVTPAAPGYDAVRVAPALGGLEWAAATVPSPHGPITVEAHADGRVRVDSPVPVVGAGDPG